MVNQHFDGEQFNEIDADHVKGSYEAVRFLIEKGYRRIAFLNGPPEYSNSMDRQLGYKQALQEYGIAFDPTLIYYGNYSRTSGIEASKIIYEHRNRMDAVFAANDRMAAGLMHGLQERGLDIGKSFPIVGYDNADICTICNPALTTVDVPFYEMGKKAGLKLITLTERKEQQYSPFRELLQTKLIVRKSAD